MATWKLKIQGIDNNITFNEKTDVGGLGNTTLVSLNIQKEVYAPGHIEAVLQIEMSTGNESFGTMSFESLLNKTVSLNDGTNDVAKDYIIFECLPRYKPTGDKTTLYLTLNIYSPEHCLTFKKYNKCYVSKKLGAEIFTAIAAKYPDKIKTIQTSCQHRLLYKNADGNKTEFIQPYLIQYEETELDFLARTANTCGEFLYYERGKWQLGIETWADSYNRNQKAIDNGKYDSVSCLKLTTNPEEDVETFCGMKEDYLETFTESDFDFDKEMKDRMGMNSFQGWLFNVGNWAKKANLAEIATGVLLDMGKNIIKSNKKRKDTEDAWNKTHVEPFKDKPEQCTMVDGKIVVCPFSNYNAKSKFGKQFYQDVRKAEKQASQEKIHINFGTYYTPYLLCDYLKILGKTYLIVKISAICKHLEDSKSTYTNLEIDAIPFVNGDWYPPLLEKEPTRRIESQKGIVTANDDPSSLGRIQFRYTWQDPESDKPSSPWIPVAQPFASKDAAIKFVPQVGDEIIIGYEHGEIGRPFMIGALATKTNKLSSVENKVASIENAVPNTKYNHDFVIKSPNGHYIKFLSPSNESFMNAVTGFSPAMRTMLGYIPGTGDIVTNAADSGKNFSGGINMGDAYGFVNINMSTDKRKVLISSAMGDVQIDAFTGITISAPSGNVKIEGKNVEIVAGNNLTLKSGANIDKMKKFYSKNLGHALLSSVTNAVVDEVKKHVKVVDLKLVRTVCDAIVKPVGGTMLIKSKRYLRLEAGKGSTALPNKAYEKGSSQQTKVLKARVNEMKVKDTINATVNLMKWYETNFAEANIRFREAINAYQNHINLWKTEMKTFIRLGGKIKYDKTDLQETNITNDKFDTAVTILSIAKKEDKQITDVHPKLDKFAFEQGTTAPYRLNRVRQHKDNVVLAAEKIACEIKQYLTSISNMDKNVGAIIQRDIINIADKSILTLSEEAYKNEIFRYLSTDIGENYDYLLDVAQVDDYAGMAAVNIQYSGQNKESKGVIETIRINLPYEIKVLDKFGQADNVTIDSVTKRKIIYDVIKVLEEAHLVTIENEKGFWNTITLDHDANKSVLDSDSVCKDTNTWKKYLDCIKTYEKKGVMSTLGKIAEKLDYFGFKDIPDWEEDILYNPEVEGEILLSDTGGNTCKISGEKVSSTPTNYVKAATRSLKEI